MSNHGRRPTLLPLLPWTLSLMLSMIGVLALASLALTQSRGREAEVCVGKGEKGDAEPGACQQAQATRAAAQHHYAATCKALGKVQGVCD